MKENTTTANVIDDNKFQLPTVKRTKNSKNLRSVGKRIVSITYGKANSGIKNLSLVLV